MRAKKKILFIASYINFSYGIEWMIEGLDKEKFEIEFIFLNQKIPEIYNRLLKKGFSVEFIKYKGKTDLFQVFFNLFSNRFTFLGE